MKARKKTNDGISLRSVYLWMIVAAVIMTIVLVYVTFHLTSSFLRLMNATNVHMELERAANELMDASDYLTEKALRFTADGNMQFLEEYFTEAKETSRREKALDKMDDDPEYDAAYSHLQDAMRYSLELMNQEYYAMKLVVEAKGYLYYPDTLQAVELSKSDSALSPEEKMRHATQLLLSEDYYTLKDHIRTSMYQCLKEIEGVTRKEELYSKDSLTKELNVVRVLFLIQIIGFLLVIWLTSRLGINPVLKAVEKIRDDDPLPEIGASEFRYLAQAYNKMYEVYRRSLENLNFKASHDELTGVYNRAGYDLIRHSVDLSTTAFLLIDADKFKRVNDDYGHETGDAVLRKIANTLLVNFRSDDYICRIGGDEFMVLMVHISKDVRHLIENKVIQINRELANADDGLPPVTVSVGVALCRDTDNPQELFHDADVALYYVKEHGRNGCCFYEPEMRDKPEGRD